MMGLVSKVGQPRGGCPYKEIVADGGHERRRTRWDGELRRSPERERVNLRKTSIVSPSGRGRDYVPGLWGHKRNEVWFDRDRGTFPEARFGRRGGSSIVSPINPLAATAGIVSPAGGSGLQRSWGESGDSVRREG